MNERTKVGGIQKKLQIVVDAIQKIIFQIIVQDIPSSLLIPAVFVGLTTQMICADLKIKLDILHLINNLQIQKIKYGSQ